MSDDAADRQFFEAHPDQVVRRRRAVPSEVPRSLAGRDIREVEVRKVSSDILLLGLLKWMAVGLLCCRSSNPTRS
jgi:hypothetical protein